MPWGGAEIVWAVCGTCGSLKGIPKTSKLSPNIPLHLGSTLRTHEGRGIPGMASVIQPEWLRDWDGQVQRTARLRAITNLTP